MRQALSVNPHPDQEIPDYLEGVKRLMFTGDVAHGIAASVNWVHELVQQKLLTPCGYVDKERRGRTERFLLFDPEEVERYLAHKGRPRMSKEAFQLSLRMVIPGGRR